jgi:Raf kinase inhibitor-like YbhB/YbcL family protein
VPFRKHALWLVALSLGVAACVAQTGEEPAMTAAQEMTVRSTAFAEGEFIPSRYTCDGDGEQPPLTWEGVPAGASALALVVDDPDAPRGTFTHWVVLDLPVDTTGLDAGALPRGAVQAENSGGRTSYAPPCPPRGVHHYRFTVYALASPTGLPEGAGLDAALRAVGSGALAWGRLVGTYQRSG